MLRYDSDREARIRGRVQLPFIRDGRVKRKHVLTLAAISSFAGRRGECRVRLGKIEQRCGLPNTRLSDSIRRLVEWGYVARGIKKGRINAYILRRPANELFGYLPVKVLRDKKVTLNMLKVYLALSSAAGTLDRCWPSAEQICERSGLSPRGVRKALDQLLDFGYVEHVAADEAEHKIEYQLPLGAGAAATLESESGISQIEFERG